MDFILITNDAIRAGIAQDAGVDFVMVDLEINGKVARQGHLNTVISRHTMEDVARVRQVLRTSKLLVRVNPLFEGSKEEIDQVAEMGADAIMLPMFTRPSEASEFVSLVKQRAEAWLLLETAAALVRVDDILQVEGIDAIHVGLNDLHLSLGLNFMFEPLAHGFIDPLGRLVAACGVKLGIGGVARLGGGLLNARLVLSEHVRLGSRQVILSRDFLQILELPESEARTTLTYEISRLRAEVQRLRASSTDELRENHRDLREAVRTIVDARAKSANPNKALVPGTDLATQ